MTLLQYPGSSAAVGLKGVCLVETLDLRERVGGDMDWVTNTVNENGTACGIWWNVLVHVVDKSADTTAGWSYSQQKTV